MVKFHHLHNKAYIVNLSRADLSKHSPAYDLAIAIGVLAAIDQVPLREIEDIIGELSFSEGIIAFANPIIRILFSVLDLPEIIVAVLRVRAGCVK
jgi:predicted ATPase with chaperone activity